MIDLQLDEEDEYRRPAVVSQPSALVRLVLRTGVVQTQRQAEYVLLGLACAGMLIALWTLFSKGHPAPSNPYEEGQNVFLPPDGAVRHN